MLIRRKRGWELRDSAATPEAAYFGRRVLLKTMAVGSMLAPGLAAALATTPGAAAEADPSAGLYPVKRNPRYTLDRPVTDPKYSEILQ